MKIRILSGRCSRTEKPVSAMQFCCLFILLVAASPTSWTLIIDDHEIEPYPHPQIPNCYSLRRNAASPTTIHCLPSVLVAGFPKCGTSALYGFLELHPSTIGTRHKEYCIRGNENLVDYLRGLPGPQEINGKVLISGCLLFETLREIVRLKPDSLKVLIIIREFAERSWAAYNFWCYPEVETCEKDSDWATKNNYRSPEMFNEIVLAQDRNISLKLWFPSLLLEAPDFYQSRISRYTDIIPQQDLHIIDSKQLESSPEVVWKGISDFLNLPLLISSSHPRIEVFRSRRYNTQNHKGEDNFQSSRGYQSQLYPISGNRPMLPKTREILNAHWGPDCLWLKETYHLTSLNVC